MAASKRLSNTRKKKLKDIIDRALHAYQTGRYDICERLCKQVEAIQPEHADLTFLRGAMLLAMHGVDQAMPYMQHAVALAPGRIDFQLNLGSIYLQDMQYRLALGCFEQALSLHAGNTVAQLGCCQALVGLNRFEEARHHLAQAQKLKFTSQMECMHMAIACRELGDMQQSMAVLDDMIARYPDFAQAYYTKALTALQMGEIEIAQSTIRQTLQLSPTHPQALMLMAESGKFESEDDERIAMILNALRQCSEESRDRVYVLHAMAHVLRKIGKHAEAFDYDRQANDLRATLREYDAGAALLDMDRIMRAYSEGTIRPVVAEHEITPVFVIGMPRCGSTLVEQILGAHSKVSGRGEIDAFACVLKERFVDEGDPDIAALAAITDEQCAELGADYIARLRASGESSGYVVDKSLNNFLLLGLICRALPGARVIHVRRHPLDTCLSIYTSNIQGSLFDYGVKLETLAAYYKKYLEVMRHWRKVLPAGVMYELEYEQLVVDQEGETRRLLNACGLLWEDACLDFQRARQRVNTASILQVRQTMYTQSVARWKRYEKQLQPLIDILGTEYPPRDQLPRFADCDGKQVITTNPATVTI